jgi:hypothetical protein
MQDGIDTPVALVGQVRELQTAGSRRSQFVQKRRKAATGAHRQFILCLIRRNVYAVTY